MQTSQAAQAGGAGIKRGDGRQRQRTQALLRLRKRRVWRAGHPLVVIGRVPLFYYVGHFGLIHVVASGLAYLRYWAGRRELKSKSAVFVTD